MPHLPAVQPVTTTGVATDSVAAEMASLLKKALTASEPSRTLDTRKVNRARKRTTCACECAAFYYLTIGRTPLSKILIFTPDMGKSSQREREKLSENEFNCVTLT